LHFLPSEARMPTGDNDNRIEILSARLALRPFTATDADEVFAAITPTLTRYMGWEPAPSQEAFAEVWRAWLLTIRDGSDLHFVVRGRDKPRFLGLVGLHRARSAEPELGIWIREDAHRNGYGREAIAAVVDWTGKHLAAESFEYPVAEQNLASRRLAESLGGVEVSRRTAPKYNSVVYRIPPRR